MHPDPNDFEALRKLLAWKRHEQPPPGYFNDFSARILARVEAMEAQEPQPWWERFLPALEVRPIIVSAYSLLVCGALLFGLSFFQIVEGELNSATVTPVEAWDEARPVPSALEANASMTQFIEAQLRPAVHATAPVEAVESARFMFEGAGFKMERASFLFTPGR